MLLRQKKKIQNFKQIQEQIAIKQLQQQKKIKTKHCKTKL